MTFWKIVDAQPVDHADETLKAYRWTRLNRPIQYHPDENGSIEERIQATEEKTDKISFMVENRAQFVSGVNVYLEPEMVSAIFEPFWNGRRLVEQDHGFINVEYQIHCDPAVVNDMFSVMVAHRETAPEPDEFGNTYDHVIVDYYNIYRPSDFNEGVIDYSAVLDDIKGLMGRFRPAALSMDQFNSVMLLQQLKSYSDSINLNCNVFEENATNGKNTAMFEAMKFSINNHLVHSYKDELNRSDDESCMLQRMLEEIQYVNGKIIKPRSKDYGHCDLADCLAVLTQRLVGNQSHIRRDMLMKSSYVPNSDIFNNRMTLNDMSRRFGSSGISLSAS